MSVSAPVRPILHTQPRGIGFLAFLQDRITRGFQIPLLQWRRPQGGQVTPAIQHSQPVLAIAAL